MDLLEQLFAQYDRSHPGEADRTGARYGFTWDPADGLILYPANYHAGTIIMLMRRSLPHIPLAVCADTDTGAGFLQGLKMETPESAAKKHPKALFVFCLAREQAETMWAALAERLPSSIAAHSIACRQLGDFLPPGDGKTKFLDMYRRSILPASLKARAKVREAYELYKDTLSQVTFLAILRRYLFSSDSNIPITTATPVYFSNVYTRRSDEVFVDCGGFTGDTLRQFLSLSSLPSEVLPWPSFKEYALFEPDPDNFTRCKEYATTLPEKIRGKVTLFPYAVGDESKTCLFEATGTVDSRINAKKGIPVPCVSLDEALSDRAPSLIKMDLQGYEALALWGAREIIVRHHPVLAISVYHYLFDLWELPLLIQRIAPGYHYILRAYHCESDYICYAVPSPRLNEDGMPGTKG
ncbi:MAG: FkbM family methyltransferase [Deltaproteobacteria bacterium]|jgi:FkbM family methyltransferase|nr:FkbM family methyltransferase [Deltaproteobacteria bacterium]